MAALPSRRVRAGGPPPPPMAVDLAPAEHAREPVVPATSNPQPLPSFWLYVSWVLGLWIVIALISATAGYLAHRATF